MLQLGMPFTTGLPWLDKVAVGIVGDPLSAHPKIDRQTQRLITYGYRARTSIDSVLKGNGLLDSEITMYEFDQNWNAVVRRPFYVDGFCFVHDFVFTENYYIFFQNPADFDPLPYVVGEKNPAQVIKWVGSSSRRTLVHVIPRNAKGKRHLLETPACFIFHHSRGFEVDDKIIVDSVVLPFFPDFDSLTSSPDEVDNYGVRSRNFSEVPINRLERITIDLGKGKVERSLPRGRSLEFPTTGHVPDAKLRHRYEYAACAAHSTKNAAFQGICRLNMDTGEEVAHFPGPRMFTTEPIFVSKPGSVEEDDGWLLMLVTDAESDRTGLFVYDGASLDRGPLGIAWLPKGEIIPYGLHGSFAPREQR